MLAASSTPLRTVGVPMKELAVLVSDQVPAPALTRFVAAPAAVPSTIGPVTWPLPAPPRPSVRVLDATALESVPARVSRPPSEVKFMPLPPAPAIVMSAVSVLSPWRFWTPGVPPLARPFDEANVPNGLV